MSDSRDPPRSADEATASLFWDDWFARHAPASKASDRHWRELARDWQAAVDAWWQALGDRVPGDGLEALRRCTDQGRGLFELAEGVAGGAASRASETDHAALWRLPLDMWERATDAILSPFDTGRAPRALGAYRRALYDYSEMLHGVGAQTLHEVADAWQARCQAAQPEAGLRALFDTCVDVGERRYQQLVSSDAFAEAGGRLINAFVELLAELEHAPGGARANGRGDQPPQSSRRPAAQPGGYGAGLDPMTLMKRLGIAPEATLAELRDFGEKLNLALATLHDVGSVDVGTSAREVVMRDGKLTLYHYQATSETTNPVPVLIVYALANRPYMMDLEPERSMIRTLLDQGLEVYLVDWGYPDRADQGLALADYVVARIGKCVRAVSQRHSMKSISLLGVCQGGTFSLCYAALHPETVRNLVLMVTPVDFHTPDNLLSAWLRHVDVDRMVDVMGNVPGAMLNWAFVSMKPLRLTGQKYLDMLDLSGDPEKLGTFLRMEKWIHDSPDQAGECFREFVKHLMQQNRLIDGTLRIGDRRVELANVSMPILNVYATKDHIVPPAAVLALEGHVSSNDYSVHGFDGGHIGIYVSARAQREVPQKIARWLEARCGASPK